MTEKTTKPAIGDGRSARSVAALRDFDERARAALAASREQISQLEMELKSRLDALTAMIARENEPRQMRNPWEERLASFEKKLSEHEASWNEQRIAWETQRAGLERDRDELQQKFELALRDVQRLRQRAADYEQELARRPATPAADSAELIAVRAERDELANELEALQRHATPTIDPDAERQIADLQRRFELAVEDVRDLKKKNAGLEAALAASGTASPPKHDDGGMDWESQKRRLLASLEHGEGPVNSAEAASIRGTIEITDAVVAEKDRQIMQLQEQLSAKGTNPSVGMEEDRNDREREILDGDEVIAGHRQRIAELERQMGEKLRSAELELSVERAKMAREKAELERVRAELESQRQTISANAALLKPGMPRRRWMSKLGLAGEES